MQASKSPNHSFDLWIALGLGLYSLGIAFWLLANGVHLTHEDGFYYFKIAQNAAHGLGSSFDGVNLTNGYHPLWLLCLIPVFWLTSTLEMALLIGTIIQAILMAIGVSLLYYTARLSTGRFPAMVAALLWILFVHPISLSGLEFSLHALGLLATAYVYLRWFAEDSPDSPRQYAILGVLMSLTFLARLDTLLLAGIMGFILVRRELKRDPNWAGALRLLAFGLPIGLACLAYGGANFYFFGHLWPISSWIKRSWSAYLLSQDPLYLRQGWLIAKLHHLLWPLYNIKYLYGFRLALATFGVSIIWLMGILGPYRTFWQQWFGQFLRRYSPFVWFSLLNFLSYILLYHGGLSFPVWYYVVQPWLAVLLVAEVLDKILTLTRVHPQKQIQRLALGGGIIIAGAIFLYTLENLQQWRTQAQVGLSAYQPLYDAAQWTRANLPKEAIIGAWNAGTIGYLSDRQVIDLDGLVNSWDYYQSKRQDLCHYWHESRITYLVDVFENRQALSVVPTYPYYAQCANQLELIWADDHYGQTWRVAVYRVP